MVESPCNAVCIMNEKTGLCEGCLRTIEEIMHWETFSDDEKRQVLNAILQRKKI